MNRFLIIALFVSTLLATELTSDMCRVAHEIPDLGVNQDLITCDNLAASTKTFKSDQARINSLVNKGIPKALDQIEEFEAYFVDACSLEDDNQFDLKIGNRPVRTDSNIIPDAEEINKIVIERLDKIENFIQTKPSVNALHNACKTVENAYDDLLCYLEWIQSEIESVWLEDILVKRAQSLKEFQVECEDDKKCKLREAKIPTVPGDNDIKEESEPSSNPMNHLNPSDEMKKAEEERQAEIARQKAEEERQAELKRQKDQADHEAEIARQKAEEERQAELARQQAEEDRQAELERQRAEAERQAEIARQKEVEERQAELERQRLEAERQAEIARQKAEEEKQAAIARQKAEEERLAELERQRVEAERQAEIARQKLEEERQAELERQRIEAERQAELPRQKAEEERQAELARQKDEEERQAEIARQKVEADHQAELDRQKAEADRHAELARQKAEEENQAEIARQKAETDRQAELARQKQEAERRQAIIDSRGIRAPLSLDSLPSDSFPSDATKTIATVATSKDDISRDNDVLFMISLNRTEASLATCAIAQYGVYDNDFLSPTTAVFQNSYFEASTTSFGFSVSDGSGGQRQFTIGTITGTNRRIETGGKPVKLIEKAAKSLTITFIDETTKTVAIDTVKSITASEFDIDLNGFSAVGHRSCLKKLSGDKQQVQIVQLITSKSHVILDGTNL